MITCEQLSDRMPAVLAGRTHWSPGEAAHLVSCQSCAAEWRLVQAAASIGSGRPAPEPGQLATAVLARVHADAARARRRARIIGGLAGLAAAAAIALVVVRPWSAGPASTGAAAAPVVFALPLAELEDATDDELRAVLATFDPAITDAQSLGEDLRSLDGDDVQRALRAWEES